MFNISLNFIRYREQQHNPCKQSLFAISVYNNNSIIVEIIKTATTTVKSVQSIFHLWYIPYSLNLHFALIGTVNYMFSNTIKHYNDL